MVGPNLSGDFDDDGMVFSTDYAILAANTGPVPGCPPCGTPAPTLNKYVLGFLAMIMMVIAAISRRGRMSRTSE